jgi:replicative DNA helicase
MATTSSNKTIPNGMSELKKLDEVIYVIEYNIRRKKAAIKKEEIKTDLSENSKIKIGAEYEFIRNIQTLIKQFKHDKHINFGRIPPTALDLETSVLGALLLERPAFKDVIGFLRPEHFYDEKHRLVYQAVLQLHADKKPIDMRTVVDQLRRNGTIETVGGAYFIAELTAKVSSAANVEYHARVVIEYAIKRQLIEMAGRIIQEAYEDTTDCFELLDFADKEIKQAQEWKAK